MSQSRTTRLLQRNGLRELVKFCLVGASSMVIDKGSLWLLLNDLLPRAPWWISATISFGLAVTNGFVWNRRWTFRARGHARSAQRQYGMFFASNLVGLLLNLGLTKLILVLFEGRLPDLGGDTPHASDVFVASVSAVPIVVIWNFAASKYWTFRTPAGGRGDGLLDEWPEAATAEAPSDRRRW